MSVPPTLHHIPICPFSQRLEILLALKGRGDAVRFATVDITRPREPHLLELTGGSTSLPVLELADGRALKESLVILRFLEDTLSERPIRRETPWDRAVENLLVASASGWIGSGYRFVMNQDPGRRERLREAYLGHLREIDGLLRRYEAGEGPWVFDDFGWVEAVYTPFFQRFAIVDYFEGVDLPDSEEFARVRAWRAACLSHPAAQQVTAEEVIKLYYDYARGAGNGALPEGRSVSSFTLEVPWRDRPWPPKDKYGAGATDAELGLL